MLLARSVSLFLRIFFLPLFLVCAVLLAPMSRIARKRKPSEFRLLWGTFPVLNYKHWSRALREAGWDSETVTLPPPSISVTSDFDRYIYQISEGPLSRTRSYPKWLFGRYLEFLRALLRYDVCHHTFDGGFLGDTLLWRLEAYLYKLADIKTVIIPIGGDAFVYSRVADFALRYALLTLGYKKSSRREDLVEARVCYWNQHADVIICGFMLDGMSRWDVLPVNPLSIETDEWRPKKHTSDHDGQTGPVTVVHTPNHRGFKGTEFLVSAVEGLRDEGLNVNLRILERRPNEEVRQMLQEEADILAEQFIATGYALSAVEGMACGLPVLSNLDNELHTRVLRRYSYLDECPILSTTPEQLRDHLRLLVTDPQLRRELGEAGRRYAEKYHSPKAAKFLFGSIYDHLSGKPVNLLNLFHPLLGNIKYPRIQHPLEENHFIPND